MDDRRLERLLRSLHATEPSRRVLDRICGACAEATAAQGAGVSLIVDRQSEVLGSSDARAARVESLQGEFAEGPCFDAIAQLRPYYEPDLTSPGAMRRWPSFAPAAAADGVGAVFAFPLVTGGIALGALDVYATGAGPLDDEQVSDSLMFADLAALAVDNALGSSTIDGVSLVTEAAESWAYSSVVHNASGMISEQLQIGVDEALLRLRAFAFVTGRKVADLARLVLDRAVRIEPWTDDG